MNVRVASCVAFSVLGTFFWTWTCVGRGDPIVDKSFQFEDGSTFLVQRRSDDPRAVIDFIVREGSGEVTLVRSQEPDLARSEVNTAIVVAASRFGKGIVYVQRVSEHDAIWFWADIAKPNSIHIDAVIIQDWSSLVSLTTGVRFDNEQSIVLSGLGKGNEVGDSKLQWRDRHLFLDGRLYPDPEFVTDGRRGVERMKLQLARMETRGQANSVTSPPSQSATDSSPTHARETVGGLDLAIPNIEQKVPTRNSAWKLLKSWSLSILCVIGFVAVLARLWFKRR